MSTGTARTLRPDHTVRTAPPVAITAEVQPRQDARALRRRLAGLEKRW